MPEAKPYAISKRVVWELYFARSVNGLRMKRSWTGDAVCCVCGERGGQAAKSSRRSASARIFCLLGRPHRASSISPRKVSRCKDLRLS